MHHVVLPAFAASLALLASRPAAEAPSDPVTLAFGPKPGTRIERTVTIEAAVESGGLEVVMNDQPVPQQFLPDLSFTLESTDSLTLVDRYVAAKGDLVGRPLVRVITDATSGARFAMDMGDYEGGESGEWTVDATTPIVDASFEIGRNAEDAVVAKWMDADVSPDDALLDGLVPEIDLAGLLPDDAVAIGATWKADAAVLAQVMEPSGDLGWEWQGDGADYMPDDAEVEYSGELELRFAEMLEGGVARIAVSGELIVVETSATDLDEVPVTDGTATDVSTTTYAVEGELTWNVGVGVMHALELECSGEGDQITTKDPDQDGPSYESSLTHEASMKISVECRLAAD